MEAPKDGAAPLHILIVGAGIGGLSAALGLRQQGHKVTMIEKSKFAAEIGAAIHSASNCSRVLRRLGVFPEEHGGTPLVGFEMRSPDGQIQGLTDLGADGDKDSAQATLKDRVLSSDAPGIQVQLHLSCRIVALDTEKATLVLDDGRSFSGDMIIGADGVHSWTRNYINAAIKPFSFGYSCYRWLAPNEDLKNHEATLELSKVKGKMVEWNAGQRRVLYYACADHTISNFGAFVPADKQEQDRTSAVGWNNPGSKAHLLQLYHDFGDEVQQILQSVPEGDLKEWDLMDMASLPTWHKGALVLIGDAAHPFLPFMGQGGAMAIEDGAALAALFPHGTTRAQVSSRLELWEECRRERVERIQSFTRWNGRSSDDPSLPRPSYEESMKFVLFCIKHDAWEHAIDTLKKHIELQ
ncbi:hypothetical protein PFICI_03329 [Pestalotiopsis fici W106-1]|uniref:FAD-binding domain-containing protein n=1 Tax=Pestalotiopsis fici (strain W106-1 / CGMCC3.15140) TaxID=1229662 RepID=W3XH33_PESFW|nr:uncharacterized protein PFICI_03329 [Pestalotiopsis fici W106-1]ETS85304.1 hypothetical protein PFICI_03329 [Pestalotiopsis fici W106-1]